MLSHGPRQVLSYKRLTYDFIKYVRNNDIKAAIKYVRNNDIKAAMLVSPSNGMHREWIWGPILL